MIARWPTGKLETPSGSRGGKVEIYIRFAEAVRGPVAVTSRGIYLQQFRGVGGFLEPVHPLFSLPLWAPPKALSKLGNIRNGDISREIPVIAHSKGKEARKLEDFESSEERLTKMKM